MKFSNHALEDSQQDSKLLVHTTCPFLNNSMNNKFYWGAATAAYQCEGAAAEDNKGKSIWDTFTAIPSHIFSNETGEVADDAYHKIKEDVARIKKLGLNAYRFSIAWARIYPLGNGDVNMAGIEHYNMLIDELLKVSIEPFVTLYHWDLPQALEDKYGGWLSPAIETDFVNYANTSFHYFGDRVKKWVTINEPWTVAYMGYGTGTHAPGRCSNRRRCLRGNSSTESYIVAHNLLNAHAGAAALYRDLYQPAQKGEIGIVLNLDWGQPLRPSLEDLCAAVRHNEFQLGWFADPLFFGRYPDRMIELVGMNSTGGRLPDFTPAQQNRLIGSVDFLGLNHYSTRFYTASQATDAGQSDTSKKVATSSLPPQLQQKQASKGVLVEVAGDLGTGWAFDQRTVSAKYDAQGQLIGPQAESEWLNTVPWGFHNVLLYVHNRYSIAYRAYRDYKEEEGVQEGEQLRNDDGDSVAGAGGGAGGVKVGSSGVDGAISTRKRGLRRSPSSSRSATRSAVEVVAEAVVAARGRRRLRSGECEIMCNCDAPSQFAPLLGSSFSSSPSQVSQISQEYDMLHSVNNRYASSSAHRQLQHQDLKNHLEQEQDQQSAVDPGDSGDQEAMKEHAQINSNTDSSTNKKRDSRSVVGIPIYVTENGCDAPGEADMPIQQALHDDFRVDYLSRYLAQLERAIQAGVDIRGYFVWSLLDNFEWADGYAKRFGIIYVDFKDPQRTRYLKDSARWYAKYVHAAQNAAQWPGASIGDYLDNSSSSSSGDVYISSKSISAQVNTGVSLVGSGLYSSVAVLFIVLFILLVMRTIRKSSRQ